MVWCRLSRWYGGSSGSIGIIFQSKRDSICLVLLHLVGQVFKQGPDGTRSRFTPMELSLPYDGFEFVSIESKREGCLGIALPAYAGVFALVFMPSAPAHELRGAERVHHRKHLLICRLDFRHWKPPDKAYASGKSTFRYPRVYPDLRTLTYG
jgi:hypothetical protein